jgi:hypothetical protein
LYAVAHSSSVFPLEFRRFEPFVLSFGTIFACFHGLPVYNHVSSEEFQYGAIQMNKLLILDKSVFHGTARSKLVRFVKCHRVILPYALCVECAISQKGNPPKDSKDPMRLTQKLLEVVKNGADAGKSPSRIVEEERSRNAAIESLIDMEETQFMREGRLDEEADLEEAREKCDKAFKPITDIVGQWADEYHKNIRKKKLEKDFREEVDESNLLVRLGKWLQFIDIAKDDILETYYSNGSNAMSADRWEWQMLRLSLAWGTELASKRNKSGPDFGNYDISNDIYDIYYVSHLSQADGLVAGDKDLVRPLAMAAFPDKDVFCSIYDVPYRYCTHKLKWLVLRIFMKLVPKRWLT